MAIRIETTPVRCGIMEVATSWAGLRLLKPFSTRWFSAGYSGVTLTFENGALGTIDKQPQGGIRIRSACGSVRFRRDDCFSKLWD